MAEEGKSIFQPLFDFVSSLQAAFHWLQSRIGDVGAGVLVALGVIAFAFLYVATHWKDVKEWLFADRVTEWLKRKPVPKARPDCLTIAVARLANDKDREHEKLLADELEHFEGVETHRAGRAVGGETLE